MISLIWVLTCSTRAFDKPFVIAASIIFLRPVIVFASFTNGASRQRLAHFSHGVEQLDRAIGRPLVDLPQLFLQEICAVQRPVEFRDPRELQLLVRGEPLRVLPDGERPAVVRTGHTVQRDATNA